MVSSELIPPCTVCMLSIDNSIYLHFLRPLSCPGAWAFSSQVPSPSALFMQSFPFFPLENFTISHKKSTVPYILVHSLYNVLKTSSVSLNTTQCYRQMGDDAFQCPGLERGRFQLDKGEHRSLPHPAQISFPLWA